VAAKDYVAGDVARTDDVADANRCSGVARLIMFAASVFLLP
jgi:hypothetical protein